MKNKNRENSDGGFVGKKDNPSNGWSPMLKHLICWLGRSNNPKSCWSSGDVAKRYNIKDLLYRLNLINVGRQDRGDSNDFERLDDQSLHVIVKRAHVFNLKSFVCMITWWKFRFVFFISSFLIHNLSIENSHSKKIQFHETYRNCFICSIVSGPASGNLHINYHANHLEGEVLRELLKYSNCEDCQSGRYIQNYIPYIYHLYIHTGIDTCKNFVVA